jgi:predicted ATP-grasp superfamily ATP-dependent carboligase
MSRELEAVALAKSSVLLIADDIGVFLGVARSLGRAGIAVDVASADEDFPGLRSRFVRHVHHVPGYLSNPETWGECIANLTREHDYRWIVPTSDSSLVLLERLVPELGREKLAIPNHDAFQTFTDKDATRRLARRVRVPVARGRPISSSESRTETVRDLGLPLVVKPHAPYSAGDPRAKTAAIIVRCAEDIAGAFVRLSGRKVLAEEFFEGEGVGVSVLAKDGLVLLAWQHRRLAEVSDTGRSCRRIGEAVNTSLLHDVRLLCADVKLTGVAMFEFRVNARLRKHILIEVNPRFWGSLPLAVASGADFPLAYWQMSHDAYVGDPLKKIRIGLKKTDLSGEFDRLTSQMRPLVSRNAASALIALTKLALKCLTSKLEFDSWSSDDYKPFNFERKMLIKNFLSSCCRRIARLPAR